MSWRIVHGFCVRRHATGSTCSQKTAAAWLQVQRRSSASSPSASDRSWVAMASMGYYVGLKGTHVGSERARVDPDQHAHSPTQPAHGRLTGNKGAAGTLFALMRSRNTIVYTCRSTTPIVSTAHLPLASSGSRRAAGLARSY